MLRLVKSVLNSFGPQTLFSKLVNEVFLSATCLSGCVGVGVTAYWRLVNIAVRILAVRVSRVVPGIDTWRHRILVAVF